MSRRNYDKALVKIVPYFLSISFIVDITCEYFFNTHIKILSVLFGTSIIYLVHLLYLSFRYKLCIHQRMFIYYMIFCILLSTIDEYIGIPITDKQYWLVFMISFGINVFFYGYLKLQHNKEINKERSIYKSIITKQEELIKTYNNE